MSNMGNGGCRKDPIDLEQMKSHVGTAAQLLKSLANENRLQILCNLAVGELSVGQLNQQVDLSQSALSQHLAVLRENELVKTRRESQTIYYSLSDSPAVTVICALQKVYCPPQAMAS